MANMACIHCDCLLRLPTHAVCSSGSAEVTNNLVSANYSRNKVERPRAKLLFREAPAFDMNTARSYFDVRLAPELRKPYHLCARYLCKHFESQEVQHLARPCHVLC